MKYLLLSFLSFSGFFAIANVASADETIDVITESDTGIVFGDLDCQMLTHEIAHVFLTYDTFDYLWADVGLRYECVDRNGISYVRSGYDSVAFLAPQFDWRSQAWVIDGQPIAIKTSGMTVQLIAPFEIQLREFQDETHVDFNVQIIERTSSR